MLVISTHDMLIYCKNITLKKTASMRRSYFSEEYENLGSLGSLLLGGTIGPAVGGFHGPCTPEPPLGPRTPGRPAAAARRRDELKRSKTGRER